MLSDIVDLRVTHIGVRFLTARTAEVRHTGEDRRFAERAVAERHAVRREIDEADERAAEMREVRYAVHASHREDLHRHVEDDEIFRFDRQQEVDVDRTFRERHTEREEDSVDRTGRTDRRSDGSEHRRNEQVRESAAESAQQIIDEETAGTPRVLQFHPEHPEREHVEEDVGEAGVQEHVREQLPEREPGAERPESECMIEHLLEVQVADVETAEEHHPDEDRRIREQQHLDHRREEREPAEETGTIVVTGLVGHGEEYFTMERLKIERSNDGTHTVDRGQYSD